MLISDDDLEPAFEPIIAVDINSALPHYSTKLGTNQTIKNDSIILVDFGVKKNHYLSDMTRMILMPKISSTIANQYQQLVKIQQQTIKKIKRDIYLKDIDQFCRSSLIRLGFPEYPHSTGHGVGLKIHEQPKVSALSDQKVTPGQVITIEPGIYFNGKYGMRVEDTILIDNKGKAKVLTLF